MLKIFKKLPDFASKMFKTIFCLWITSSNPSPRLENIRGLVMIVKLRKGQKFKLFENNRCYALTFNMILMVLLRSLFEINGINYCHFSKDLFWCFTRRFLAEIF